MTNQSYNKIIPIHPYSYLRAVLRLDLKSIKMYAIHQPANLKRYVQCFKILFYDALQLAFDIIQTNVIYTWLIKRKSPVFIVLIRLSTTYASVFYYY